MPDRRVFRAIADSTYDWESWIGPDGRTRWINPGVERATGYSVSECLAMDDYPLSLVHELDHASVREALSGALAGTHGNDMEFRIRHKGGELRWGAMSWQPLVTDDGEALGYRTSVRDITDRKLAEQRLVTALTRAEAAERAKSILLAHVSHELRTPIHNLLGHAELLARAPLDRTTRSHVRVLNREGRAMLTLVDDLLEAAAGEVERAQGLRTAFDLRALVRRVAEAYRATIEARGVALVVRLPDARLRVRSDAAAIERVLRVLLDNARKFTLAGRIVVTLRAPRAGLARLVVKDTGIGIAEDELSRLWRPFARGAAATERNIEGLGLGLAIARRAADRAGASLEVESAPGEGTSFTLLVPQVPTVRPVQRRARLRARSVLVIDDRAPSRELAGEQLRTLGVRVDLAASAREGLALARERDHDVVLMDLHMPELDGYAAIQLLRAQLSARAARPRILALTADVFAGAELARHGFDGHLTKPLDLDALARALEHEHEPAHDEPLPARDPVAADVLARFAPRLSTELRELAQRLEGGDALAAHSIAGTAGLLGDHALASEASELHARSAGGAPADPEAIARVSAMARARAAQLETAGPLPAPRPSARRARSRPDGP